MFLARMDRNESVKIRMDGRDKDGHNTTRNIKLYDCNVDEVYEKLLAFLRDQTLADARSVAPAGGQKKAMQR